MRIAVVSMVLDDPREVQGRVNEVIASYKSIVKGRMGIPLNEEDVSVISLAVIGENDEINALTGKLGAIDKVNVKTSFSKKEI